MVMGSDGGGPEAQGPEQVSRTPERWVVPNQAIINSPEGPRSVGMNPVFKDVLSKEGQRLGQVMEVTLEASPGDTQASLDFKFQKTPEGDYQVLTSGGQSWSSSVIVGQYTDKLVGMRPYEKSLGGKTAPFFEPGPGNEQISQQEGRSYGWVCFRDAKGGEDVALGVVPDLVSLEDIRYRQEGDSIVVRVAKNLEGVSSKRPITFKVFLGQGNPRQESAGKVKYADLMLAFSKELSRLSGNVPLMKGRVIGFSWAAYGPKITQEAIQAEVEAGKDVFDTYVIDDGWETSSGSLIVDTKKFSDLAGLAQYMKQQLGIKPGIWACPFRVTEEGAKHLPQEWFMKDKDGKPLGVKLPMPISLLETYVAKTRALDISIPEVRTYLADQFLELARKGFEVFKVDYLYVPFTGKLQNQDKTSVEYYRQTLEGIRQRIREELGREIELIGCGAPMMESIGLFNGIRMTADSALANLEGMPVIGGLVSLLKRIPLITEFYAKANTGMYVDTVAVAARRTLLFSGPHALILDGIHMADPEVPLDPNRRDVLNKSILALNRLGIGNLFVGDSLVRAGEEGKKIWREYINNFKNINISPKLRALFNRHSS